MAFEFKLPDIGEGVVEGEVVKWKVKEGDTIQLDQPMVEIMTDKATVEIPAPRGGKVARIMIPEGKICAVGQVLIVIEEAGKDKAATTGNGKGNAQVEQPTSPPMPAQPPVAAKIGVPLTVPSTTGCVIQPRRLRGDADSNAS